MSLKSNQSIKFIRSIPSVLKVNKASSNTLRNFCLKNGGLGQKKWWNSHWELYNLSWACRHSPGFCCKKRQRISDPQFMFSCVSFYLHFWLVKGELVVVVCVLRVCLRCVCFQGQLMYLGTVFGSAVQSCYVVLCWCFFLLFFLLHCVGTFVESRTTQGITFLCVYVPSLWMFRPWSLKLGGGKIFFSFPCNVFV